MPENESTKTIEPLMLTGNIFVYYAYDVGDDINLSKVEALPEILTRPLHLSKYFKGYHVPLSIDLPHPHSSSKCLSTKLHNFGVISLAYKIPFSSNFEELRKTLNDVDTEFREQSVEDAQSVYKKIKLHIKQSRFFHLRSSYVVIQVDQQPQNITVSQMTKEYGGFIASLVRFETESLSEYQKNAILDAAIGYYRGDLIVIDMDSAFVYDDEYEELLDLFEFANIQQLELQYYDRILDQQLNAVYQREVKGLPFKAYLPFIGTLMKDPVSDLGMLKVEISSIIERLESTIKAVGEVYVTETYNLLVEKLDLKSWKVSISTKLDIIKDIHLVYQNKIDIIREDLLSVLVILLIFIELVVGIFSYFKR
ncbi:MAG: hypothetical protein WDZ41_04480 [Candidatus Babeliales bacterium]